MNSRGEREGRGGSGVSKAKVCKAENKAKPQLGVWGGGGVEGFVECFLEQRNERGKNLKQSVLCIR